MLLILSEPMHFLPTHLQDLNSALTNSSFESDSAVVVVVVGGRNHLCFTARNRRCDCFMPKTRGAIHLLCGFTDI